MRIEQLQYLLDIKKTNSIGKTAENFFVSRQVVSSNIRALEHELGVQILARTHTGTSFTTVGERIVEKADILLTVYQDLLNTAAGVSNTTATKENLTLSIYTIPRLAQTLCLGLITSLKKYNPEIAIKLFELPTSNEVIETVDSCRTSIGLIAYPDKKIGWMCNFHMHKSHI